MFSRNKSQGNNSDQPAPEEKPAEDVKSEQETPDAADQEKKVPDNSLTAAFAQWVAESRASKSDFIVAMIQRIFQEGVQRAASDIHFQPGRLGVEVRFRLDGVLHLAGMLPQSNVYQIAARIKVLANLVTFRQGVPQEGRIPSGLIPEVTREIRISTVPCLYGERIVARFFSAGNLYQQPEELGFTDQILDSLKRAVTRTSGAVLVTGPAGSGKSTTVAALLRHLVREDIYDVGTVRSIVTLEDPIESAIDGVSQIEITQDGDTTLDRLLLYLLRQDPDVIVVGEIRDRPTAEAAMQAALTGHLLLSTFHSTDAASAISRFLELGIEPFTLRSSLEYVLCQRLVRRLCPHCRREMTSSTPAKIHVLRRAKEVTKWYEPVGCEKCNGTGYSGRSMVAESLPLKSEEMANAILERRETSVLQRIGEENGMVPFHDLAVNLIEDGVTSPVEILRVFGV